MPTIIDSLLVTLGLDAKQYLKGKDEAEAGQKKFRDSTKKGADEISDTLVSLGKSAAALFLGFETAKGALSWFAGLNTTQANLGRFAYNVGEGAHELNKWGTAAELVGGNAADVQGDVANLSRSLTDLKTDKGVSELLQLFQRLHVNLYDSQGQVKTLTELYKELGGQLKLFSPADAANFAKSAGISDSLLNLITAQGDELERNLALAEANNKVTDESTKHAAQLQREWTGIGLEVRGVGQELLDAVSPGALAGFNWITKALATSVVEFEKMGLWLGKLGAQAAALAHGDFKSIGQIQKEFNADLDRLNSKANSVWAEAPVKAAAAQSVISQNQVAKGEAAYSQFIGKTEELHGIPPGLLRNIIATESNFNPNAKNASGATGIAQLRGAKFPNAGKDPYADIESAAGYLLELRKQFGDWTKAVAAYNDGPGNINKVLRGEKALPAETSHYIGKVLGANANALDVARFANAQSSPDAANTTGTRGGASSSVQIDQINIHTKATDARGIASAIPDELRRKGVVAQADQGMS